MQLHDAKNVKTILVSYLPVPPSIGEMKTKPTQHAVREMNRVGIAPDFLICRSELPLDEPRKEKLSKFCGVEKNHIITAANVRSIYEVPLAFEAQGFAASIVKAFGRKKTDPNLAQWKQLVEKITSVKEEVRIGVIGKYFSTGDFLLSDAYLSVLEAIKHAAWAQNKKPVIEWLNAEAYEKDTHALAELEQFDGILIPGGFGSRGIEGKIAAIRYVREHNIPYFGICYGMQCAVIEYARTRLNLPDANTEEINPHSQNKVIHLMKGQKEKLKGKGTGGTLRLGAYPCVLKEGSVAKRAYNKNEIEERHRHRYEFNAEYTERLAQAGMDVSGISPDGTLAEIVEIKNHPFFVGVQFHPEFRSRPLAPHPLFYAFVKAAIEKRA